MEQFAVTDFAYAWKMNQYLLRHEIYDMIRILLIQDI